MALKNQAGLIKIIGAIECIEKCLSCVICVYDLHPYQCLSSLEVPSEPIESRCGHVFCRLCMQKLLSNQNESCPICKEILTRRSFKPSEKMARCVQQLSKLVDAIRSDIGIDITSCLKMHYKKRDYLPSCRSPSPQQELENERTFYEAENKIDKDMDENVNLGAGDEFKVPLNESRQCLGRYDTLGKTQSSGQSFDKSKRKAISKKCDDLNDESTTSRPNVISDTTNQLNFNRNTEKISKGKASSTWTNEANKANEAISSSTSNHNLETVSQKVNKRLPESSKSKLTKPAVLDISPETTNQTVGCGRQRRHSNTIGKVVRFEKLGHLFKPQKKVVSFYYRGKVRNRRNELRASDALCTLCSASLLSERPSLQKPRAGLLLNRSKCIKSSNFDSGHPKIQAKQRSFSSSCDSQTNNVETGIEDEESENTITETSGKKLQSVYTTNCLRGLNSLNERRSPFEALDSSIIIRKRKPSESPENRNRFSKRANQESDLREFSSLKDVENHLSLDKTFRERPSSSRLVEFDTHEASYQENEVFEPQENVQKNKSTGEFNRSPIVNKRIDLLEASEASEVENENIETETNIQKNKLAQYAKRLSDTGTETSLLEASEASKNDKHIVQSRNDFKKINLNPEVNKGSGFDKKVSTLEAVSIASDLHINLDNSIGGEEHFRVFERAKVRNSEFADEDLNFSRDSMMDITCEELLLKKFEEQLFGKKKSDNETKSESGKEIQREDRMNTVENNNSDISTLRKQGLSPEPMNVSVAKTPLVERNQNIESIEFESSPMDFIEMTLPDGISGYGNPANVNQLANVFQSDQQKSTVSVKSIQQTESFQNANQLTTKVFPVYQSTPKALQQRSTSRSTLDQQNKLNFDSSPRNSENNRIQSAQNLDLTKRQRGCILCSGLTTRQTEDVKRLSDQINMEFTKKFSDEVSHVIVKTNDENNGACKTLKYLQGVVNRKWVLNFNWILDCLAQKKLLNEEPYEVVDSTTLIPGPRKARMGEKAPFENFVFYCVEPFQNISVPEYEDLLRCMGATVVGSLSELATQSSIFKIIAIQAEYHENKIIEWHQITKAVPVAQEWIVECISQYRLVSLLPFLQELVPQDVMDLGFPEELIQEDDCDIMSEISG